MTRLLLLGILVFGMAGFVIGQNGQGQNQGNTVPEPSQVAGALVLLGGTTLFLRGRHKK